jgi:hypothetical protein
MRRVLVGLLVVLAGCSSTVQKEDRGRKESPETQQPQPFTAAPFDRPPESKDVNIPAEPEREVDLPAAVELAQSPPALPAMPRVAVACVRGGKLVRRPDFLRKLSHGFEREARLEALERLEQDAPSRVNLDVLCARAEKQGAVLLLVDARKTDEDADRTTYVLTAKGAWQALAFTQPKATEPPGQELVARLVRSSRGNP